MLITYLQREKKNPPPKNKNGVRIPNHFNMFCTGVCITSKRQLKQ